MLRSIGTLLLFAALAGCASAPATVSAPAAAPDVAELTRQVTAAETAFAKSMADRDFAAFASFVAEDAVFVNGRDPQRGKAVILSFWKKFFEGPEAPFSWQPETVVVLDTGLLASSKGPVFDPAGKPILEFRSTWRLESPGVWKIVFDDGTCRCGPPPAQP